MKQETNAIIHIIGIGGTGMSAIAVVLHEQGMIVRGSDQTDSEMAARLRALGIEVTVGHRAENVDGADIVLYSSAVHPENPEFDAACRRGIPSFKRSEFLTRMLDGREVVAVAGTHGKTTTASMIAWILSEASAKPGFIIGSTPKNLGTNAAAGESKTFVIEADEYDRMFHGLRPATAVLTLVEPDHPDCYPNDEEYYQAFREFIARCEPGADVLIFSGDPIQSRLVAESGADVRIVRYGFDENDDYRILNAEANENGGYRFTITIKARGESVPVQLAVPGLHNVIDAAAALAVIDAQSVPLRGAADALSRFNGSARRFETIADRLGIRIIDDYAHHPTEIRATLQAAKSAYPKRRIVALWQPHTFSRTKRLLAEFVDAFADADEIFVTNIYAARETESDFGFADLKKALRTVRPDAVFAATNERAIELLAIALTEGDIVVTLSAGDANRIGPEALAILEKRNEAIDPDVLEARVIQNAPIAAISNLRVGGPAAETLTVRNEAELIAAVRDAQARRIPFKVVGGLTNILFSDGGYPGRLIVNRADEMRLIRHENGSAGISVSSGTALHDLVRASIDFNLSGLEWATRIPGSVGGAIYGNAGAYGSEINAALKSVTVLTPENEIVEIPKDEIEFVYRASAFKAGKRAGVLISAFFELTAGDPEAIQARSDEIWDKREKFNFRNQGSLGSVFRNPSGDYAGRLITECGLRGAAEGGAAVSDFHGNIFVTNPGATAADFVRLIERVRDAVDKKFGIRLNTEIEIHSGKDNA